MGVNEYSNNVCKNTKERRIGCSVCPKKNINVKLADNSSSNKPWLNRKCLKSNVTSTKHKEFEKSKITPTVILKPIIKECYCNHMEKIKKETFPRLICSKYFKIPNLIDKDWLHEIVEFRRENWFDCHSNSSIDANCVKNINPLYIFNNYLNDPLLLNSIGCNEFNTENLLDNSTRTIKEKKNVKKKH